MTENSFWPTNSLLKEFYSCRKSLEYWLLEKWQFFQRLKKVIHVVPRLTCKQPLKTLFNHGYLMVAKHSSEQSLIQYFFYREGSISVFIK